MYKEHPVFEKPKDENAKIWRYMDFTQYVSLLDKSVLFFPRADKLGDPFEGSFPRGNVMLRSVTYKDVLKDDLSNLSQYYKAFGKFTAISCWHLNEYESAAMWKLYLKSNEGIAIQSTFRHLKSSFIDENHIIYIGQVKYIDYEKDLLSREGSLNPFVHKRKSFAHEQELRAVIQSIPRKTRGKEKGHLNFDKPLCQEGLSVAVDLNLLIDKIYLAPTCPEWLLGLVRSVTGRYGLNKEILPSALDVARPLY